MEISNILIRCLVILLLLALQLSGQSSKPFTAAYKTTYYAETGASLVRNEMFGRYESGTMIHMAEIQDPSGKSGFIFERWDKSRDRYDAGTSSIKAYVSLPASISSTTTVTFPGCEKYQIGYQRDGSVRIGEVETEIFTSTDAVQTDRVWIAPQFDCLVIKEEDRSTLDGRLLRLQELTELSHSEPPADQTALLNDFIPLDPAKFEARYYAAFNAPLYGEKKSKQMEESHRRQWARIGRQAPRE